MQPVAILFCLAACAPTAAKPDQAPAPSPRAPMIAEWVLQEAPAGRLSLIARIHRHSPFSVPINVTITVPEGLRLLSGRTSFSIPENAPMGVTDEPLVFEVVRTPAQDLILEADARGPDFGVHAKRAYTFGRPQKQLIVAPQEKGPELEVGERKFGPSVPAPK